MRLPARLGWLLLAASLLLAHVHCENVFGIVGENFTFPVKIDRNPLEILWTKNKHKVAEWEGQNKTMYFTSLRNRGLLNKENGRLTIFNLENNDTGTYVLKYLDSVNKDWNLNFILAVLAPPSEPEISCNISGDDLVLKCTANFQKPLKYTWKFSSSLVTHQTQEVSVPKNVDASEKATCFIKFSQTEKSSEISLTECFPDKKGDLYDKRSRGGLIAAFVLLIPVVGIGGFLFSRGRTKSATENAAQRNSPVHGSGEHEPLCSVDIQEQPSSERANSSQVADSQNEKPEADKDLNEDSPPEEKQRGNEGVKQEGRTKSATENAAQRNSPVHGSGGHEPLCSVDIQEQPSSERANSSQVADSQNEKPEADKDLNEDSPPEEKQRGNEGVKQEEFSTKQNSTLMCADDHGVTEGDTSKEESSSLHDKHGNDHAVNEGVTHGAEDGSKDLRDSPSCSEEDVKS